MSDQRPAPSVLLVEDNGVDVRIFERAARSVGFIARVEVVSDGLEALAYLRAQIDQNQRDPGPSLIILDLNMPNMTGLEFLEVIRQDPQLAHKVVFVLTTSSAAGDVNRAYELNVAGYLTKDSTFVSFQSKVELINDYLRKVALPASIGAPLRAPDETATPPRVQGQT